MYHLSRTNYQLNFTLFLQNWGFSSDSKFGIFKFGIFKFEVRECIHVCFTVYLLKVKKLPLQLCWCSGLVSTGLPYDFCSVSYIFSHLVHEELLYRIQFLIKCHYCLTLVFLPVFCEVQELLCIPLLYVFHWLQVSWSPQAQVSTQPKTLRWFLCRSLEFSFSTAPSSVVHCPASCGCLAIS